MIVSYDLLVLIATGSGPLVKSSGLGAFRWYVAVQAAAIEHEGWLPALRRSRQLTAGVYGHLFGFWILVGIISEVPLLIGRVGATGHDTLVVVFVGGVIPHAFALAFAALAMALLYFDLVSRRESASLQSAVR